MQFTSIRLITANAQRLAAFYEAVLGQTAAWYTEAYAELKPGGCTLAIAAEQTLAFSPDSGAVPAQNRSAILEFRVADVDAEYTRLRATIEAIQEPTTMPWGNRSLLFRDPDNNLVNLFTPVTDAAKARSGG